MNRGRNSSHPHIAAVWHIQSGRSRVQRGVAADGFRTEYPYAGVTVVAENTTPDDDKSADIAVETVRDVFAEGVAFGVEDALRDSFEEASELIRRRGHEGCSAAALAFSGSHVWYALAGNCRIYRVDSDGVRCIVQDRSSAAELNIDSDDPDFAKRIRNMNWWLGAPGKSDLVCGHTRIHRDTTYIIMTSGCWVQFEKVSPALHRKGMRRTLQGWLSMLSRDLKLAYRRQGGAMAAVSGEKGGASSPVSWRALGSILLSIVLVAYLVLGRPFSCGEEPMERSDLFSADTVPEEIVQPLAAHTGSTADTTDAGTGMLGAFSDSMFADTVPPVPDISAELPMQTVLVGEEALSLPADTFAVSLNTEPDSRWENFSSGIYAVGGDSAAVMMAESLQAVLPELDVILLDRILTVRESGVAESASWLSSLDPDSAASTGVIVETRSSVAGGAAWIRNYPVFANGNREDRSGEAGGFRGDSLPGIPLLRNSSSYRLIVVL